MDLGWHQVEQFLYYTRAKDARVDSSRVANYNFKQYAGFQDFGDATLGTEGFIFFGRHIRDCLDGTQTAYNQEITFRAIVLSLEAQEKAVVVE